MFDIKSANFVIYNGYIEENYRTILTRWRLLNFDLHIETVRYSYITCKQRICKFCTDNVVENEDGTFSVYKIKSVYPSSYIPLEKTFNRISSILHRELQEVAKKEAIKLFYKELNIVKNDSLF